MGSNHDVHSTSGRGKDLEGTIKEDDSEYSASQIGSLVSYTINYMEKKSFKGAGISTTIGERLGEEGNTDSDEDNSALAEREDSHSDIDTIEEEVDLSSEGSDRDENPHESQTEAETK